MDVAVAAVSANSTLTQPQEAAATLTQPQEAAAYVQRVFRDVFCDLTPAADARVATFFHPEFVQESDGRRFGRDEFCRMLHSQKAHLKCPPEFTFKQLIVGAAVDDVARVHVTSVHSVRLDLKDHTILEQSVICLVQICLESGQICRCDELTRMQTASPCPATVAAAPDPLPKAKRVADAPRLRPGADVQPSGSVTRSLAQPPRAPSPSSEVSASVSALAITSNAKPLAKRAGREERHSGESQASHESYDSTMAAFEAEYAAQAVPEEL